jgi:periplasmic divalent cation tolerance protein
MQCEACVVLVTCGSQAEAAVIAERIVIERLAACVNMIAGGSPVRSFYIWEDSLQQDEEWLLLIKTMPARLASLKKRIRELHSYTVPEFIALPILSGSEEYLDWLRQRVSSAE